MAFTIKRNDKFASIVIFTVSVIIFLAIAALPRLKLNIHAGFDVHVFARLNAIINSTVAVLLIGGLYSAKTGRYTSHRYLMMTSIILSVLFLLSYIAHHLLAGDTKYGGEGSVRYFYFFILITHIILAAVILPFILFTAYRALSGNYQAHKKLGRITWPIWFYVAVTGPLLYLMISPYYTV
jgi:putative membrane protein